MKINEIKKQDGSTVYRANVYLGVDAVTGKKVTTKVTARTKKELKTKAQQAQFDHGGIATRIQLKLTQE